MIKIYISSRIDLNSYFPKSRIFEPVACGACYARNKLHILGDNTGDNISSRRLTFNEFTVQYWAWKNSSADYIGLCHYRRFLNFSDEIFEENFKCQVDGGNLDYHTATKFGFLDDCKIHELCTSHDIVVAKECDVKKIGSPRGTPNSVYELWNNHVNVLILPESLSILMDIIQEKFPEYLGYAKEYINGRSFRGYNLFVMKRELFISLCEFEFTVLFELEKRLDFTNATELTTRTCGYIGEILFSIFVYSQIKKGAKYKELQLVYFSETRLEDGPIQPQKEKVIVLKVADFNIRSAHLVIESLKEVATDEYEVVLLCDTNVSRDKIEELVSCTTNNIKVSVCFPELMRIQNGDYIQPIFDNAEFYIPWLIEHNKPILFVDTNTIFCSDLSDLYRNLNDEKAIYAVKAYEKLRAINGPDCSDEHIRISRLIRGDPFKYISSSLMFINTKVISMKYMISEFHNVLKNSKLNYSHNDLWNLFFKQEDIGILNYDANMLVFPGFELPGSADFAPITERRKWLDCQQNAKTITSPFWIDPKTPYSSEFWQVARRVCCYESFIQTLSTLGRQVATGNITTMSSQKPWIRRLADEIFPLYSRRRKFLKAILPNKSGRTWSLARSIYYRFFN